MDGSICPIVFTSHPLDDYNRRIRFANHTLRVVEMEFTIRMIIVFSIKIKWLLVIYTHHLEILDNTETDIPIFSYFAFLAIKSLGVTSRGCTFNLTGFPYVKIVFSCVVATHREDQGCRRKWETDIQVPLDDYNKRIRFANHTHLTSGLICIYSKNHDRIFHNDNATLSNLHPSSQNIG